MRRTARRRPRRRTRDEYAGLDQAVVVRFANELLADCVFRGHGLTETESAFIDGLDILVITDEPCDSPSPPSP